MLFGLLGFHWGYHFASIRVFFQAEADFFLGVVCWWPGDGKSGEVLFFFVEQNLHPFDCFKHPFRKQLDMQFYFKFLLNFWGFFLLVQEDQIVLKLTGRPIVVSSDFTEVNLLPEGLPIDWELTIDGLNADFGSLDGSLVDKFVIVVCIDFEVVLGAAKVVDALVYGDLVGKLLGAEDVNDVLEIWI